MALAVDLSTAGMRRRRLEFIAESQAQRLRSRADHLRHRAARARLGSNERRKMTLRADGFEAAAEQIIEQARVAQVFRRGWLDRVMRKKLIVHTLDDKSIEGVLWERTADGLILRAAVLLGEGQTPNVTMAGEVFVPRANVAFAQLDE